VELQHTTIAPISQVFMCVILLLITDHHHRYHEYNRGLDLKTCSHKAQVVLGLLISVFVFPYATIPEAGTGKPASVGDFCPFIVGDPTN
jgi:hypothetical protein